MPLYEYTCAACAGGFTLLQSVHAGPGEATCPACGGRDVVRRMSTFAPAVAEGAAPAPTPGGPCGAPGCGGGGCGL